MCQACNKNTLNKLTKRRRIRYWQSECLGATAVPADFRLPWAPCRRPRVYSWPGCTEKNPVVWHVFLRHLLCAGTISSTLAWGEHRFKCREKKGPREHCYCCRGLDESGARGSHLHSSHPEQSCGWGRSRAAPQRGTYRAFPGAGAKQQQWEAKLSLGATVKLYSRNRRCDGGAWTLEPGCFRFSDCRHTASFLQLSFLPFWCSVFWGAHLNLWVCEELHISEFSDIDITQVKAAFTGPGMESCERTFPFFSVRTVSTTSPPHTHIFFLPLCCVVLWDLRPTPHPHFSFLSCCCALASSLIVFASPSALPLLKPVPPSAFRSQPKCQPLRVTPLPRVKQCPPTASASSWPVITLYICWLSLSTTLIPLVHHVLRTYLVINMR